MKRHWDEQELTEHWSLTQAEFELLRNRTDRTRFGFAVLLKFFQVEGRFPSSSKEVPAAALDYLAHQLGFSREGCAEYDFSGRSSERDRAQIRFLLGFRRVTLSDAEELVGWIRREILPADHKAEHLQDAVLDWCRRNRLEPPTPSRIDRIVGSALKAYEADFFATAYERLPESCRVAMDALLQTPHDQGDGGVTETTPFAELRADPGRPSLESVLREISKLQRITALDLPDTLFETIPPKVLEKYRLRAAGEPPRELRRHPEAIRYTLVAAFCWQRRKEIIDGLVDLLIQLVHRIGARAERKVVKALLEDLRKVHGKTTLLYRIAEAAVGNPDGIVREVLYPIVGEQTLWDLVREFKSTGPAYQKTVHTTMRASYSSHYRRMLPPLLDALEFRSNNAVHRPVIDALEFLKARRESKQRHFSLGEGVPIDGVVRNGWKEIVIEKDKHGVERINRINYEIAVLQALRERLRCKEIWVVGADRYRNSDDDLPADFEVRRADYYEALKQPREAEQFVADLQRSMTAALDLMNQTLPRNRKVRVLERRKGRICVSPIDPQPEPVNLSSLKAEITRRWPMTSLLDVFKETDLRVGFTDEFQSISSREVLGRGELRKRLLLGLYGLGTNTGLKRVCASDIGITYKELLHVRHRFIRKDCLRSAIARVVNAIFAARLPEIWGEGTTACASDSKKFGAWDQNLMTEWHIRYGGRGVMIYWHVEKKSVCIYSQLKRCSSSEVAAMIEGVLRHCTEMSVEKNYVDSHGQSEVAFAFCHLLGFELLPRLKGISRQKLYRPGPGSPGDYPHLEPILSRPIDWELIRRQYDEMVKYATALRLGTAETEAILRRFTKGNLKHPTYLALAELGKAKKTVFLCRYLHSEALRQEVEEALNVVERWNGTNGFIFFGKGGEVATNRLEDQEISVLCLHLLQILSRLHQHADDSECPGGLRVAQPHGRGGLPGPHAADSRPCEPLRPVRARHGNAFAPGSSGWSYGIETFPRKAVFGKVARPAACNDKGLRPGRRPSPVTIFGKVLSDGSRDATMILLAYRHGLRVSELIALRWEQIDLRQGMLHVRRRKNGSPSTHPLRGPEIRALRKLARAYPETPYVFVSERKGPLTDSAFRKIVARAGSVAGLDFPVHPHMLRHSTGFKLANDGQDTRAIQHYLGHKNIQHTVRYTELSSDRFKEFWDD